MNLAGIRIGAIITQNESLLCVVKNTSMYTAVPAIVQKVATRLLNETGIYYHICSHVRHIQIFLGQEIKNTNYLNVRHSLFHSSVILMIIGLYIVIT